MYISLAVRLFYLLRKPVKVRSQEIRDLFKEYVNLVSELFEQYNKRVPEEKQLKISDELWADDVPPKIASGRP
jgi:hypothetical protein